MKEVVTEPASLTNLLTNYSLPLTGTFTDADGDEYMYVGEGNKDGKPHGMGEIRYKNEGWTTLYIGSFVDGQEHGEGRCRYKAGGWGYCRYYKGKRT